MIKQYFSGNHCQRKGKHINTSISSNAVPSHAVNPGSKRPISVIFLTPEKEARKGSIGNLKALSAAERDRIEGTDSRSYSMIHTLERI